jgi:hypothetical protein
VSHKATPLFLYFHLLVGSLRRAMLQDATVQQRCNACRGAEHDSWYTRMKEDYAANEQDTQHSTYAKHSPGMRVDTLGYHLKPSPAHVPGNPATQEPSYMPARTGGWGLTQYAQNSPGYDAQHSGHSVPLPAQHREAAGATAKPQVLSLRYVVLSVVLRLG